MRDSMIRQHVAEACRRVTKSRSAREWGQISPEQMAMDQEEWRLQEVANTVIAMALDSQVITEEQAERLFCSVQTFPGACSLGLEMVRRRYCITPPPEWYSPAHGRGFSVYIGGHEA